MVKQQRSKIIKFPVPRWKHVKCSKENEAAMKHVLNMIINFGHDNTSQPTEKTELEQNRA